MEDTQTRTIVTGEPQYAELRQVTVKADEEIAAVNQLVAEGWRLIGIQSRADAVVYVLGRIEKKSKRGTGFLSAD
jgi:hypothetical protein